MAEQAPQEIKVYCNCMEGTKYHLDMVEKTLTGVIVNLQQQDVLTEVIFLHLRKALEKIAFASLSANRERYAAARAGFATEWNARRMLGFIEKVNPNFYPLPMKAPEEIAPGRKHFQDMDQPFLTRSDFEKLYDCAAEILHARNPFSPQGDPIDTHYSVQGWISRIRNLIGWHVMQIPDLQGLWVVNVPKDALSSAAVLRADSPFVVQQRESPAES